jgi:hypothetical protein
MNLKTRITEVVTAQGHTYSELARYIGLSEPDLDFALEHNSIDIRTLELISKALHISLYSFFRDNNARAKTEEKAYYDFNLWSPHESKLKTEIDTLRKQILELKSLLAEKDELIARLKKG